MEEDVMPRFFKSNLFKSFQRQLNYFGFEKLEQRGKHNPTNDPNASSYIHALFKAGRPENLHLITRKVNLGNVHKRLPYYKKQKIAIEEEPSYSVISRATKSRSGRKIPWRTKYNASEEKPTTPVLPRNLEKSNTPVLPENLEALFHGTFVGTGACRLSMIPGLRDEALELIPAYDVALQWCVDPMLPPCAPLVPAAALGSDIKESTLLDLDIHGGGDYLAADCKFEIDQATPQEFVRSDCLFSLEANCIEPPTVVRSVPPSMWDSPVNYQRCPAAKQLLSKQELLKTLYAVDMQETSCRTPTPTSRHKPQTKNIEPGLPEPQLPKPRLSKPLSGGAEVTEKIMAQVGQKSQRRSALSPQVG
jgi:hypothetical protein